MVQIGYMQIGPEARLGLGWSVGGAWSLTIEPDEVLDRPQANVRLEGGGNDERADQDERNAVTRVVSGVEKERTEPHHHHKYGDGKLLHQEDEEVAPHMDDDLTPTKGRADAGRGVCEAHEMYVRGSCMRGICDRQPSERGRC